MQACKRVHKFLSNYASAMPVVYARAAASTTPGDPGNKHALMNAYNE